MMDMNYFCEYVKTNFNDTIKTFANFEEFLNNKPIENTTGVIRGNDEFGQILMENTKHGYQSKIEFDNNYAKLTSFSPIGDRSFSFQWSGSDHKKDDKFKILWILMQLARYSCETKPYGKLQSWWLKLEEKNIYPTVFGK